VTGSLAIVFLAAATVLVLWPRFKPRPRDPVERVAQDYLQSLVDGNTDAQRRLSTIEEPPAISSYRAVEHARGSDQVVKGPFAELAALHRRIDGEFTYDPAVGRFTPKNPLGAAAATLDAVQSAKDDAKKSRMYEKMASGDPNDIFDAAESLGKVFTQLAEGALAPKKILPTYKMLVQESKPPLPGPAKELAEHVAEHPGDWYALLKRPFHTLKPDGPFVFERAQVQAQVTDKLASLGDPPTTLRLFLVRFRLEGIDTGWRITSARRVLPGAEEAPSEPESPGATPAPEWSPNSRPESEPSRSLGNPDIP
jgi:hypothetical protein